MSLTNILKKKKIKEKGGEKMIEDDKNLVILPVFNYLLKDGKIHSLEELVNSYSEDIVEQKDSLGIKNTEPIKGILFFRIHRVCKKLMKQGVASIYFLQFSNS